VVALHNELSHQPDVKIIRGPRRQEYDNIEIDVLDPNGYVLVFAEVASQAETSR